MGREKAAPLTPEIEANLARLLEAVNALQLEMGRQITISSGYRPPAINSRVPGAAKKSAHMNCQAVDILDPDGWVDTFIYSRRAWLHAKLGIYQEHPDYTKGWAHVDIRGPKSGNRVFIP